MDAGTRRALVMFGVTAAVLAVLAVIRAPEAATTAVGGHTTIVSDETRAAGLIFAPGVAPGDQAWILAAMAKARPEAQALIGEVDGTVEVTTHQGFPLGVTRMAPREGTERMVQISLDIGLLNGRRTIDRDVVMLHEFGHVVDFLLVDEELNAKLEAGIPRTGTCVQDEQGSAGSCAEPQERFADTFAKWALRGRVSAAGAGYGIVSPPSLEDWGAPLTVLSYTLGRD
jgi:hypothetical protein